MPGGFVACPYVLPLSGLDSNQARLTMKDPPSSASSLGGIMNESLNREELPLPDYDHIPLGTLGSRISSLDEQGLQALLGYEQGHGNRLPVVQVLEARIDALKNGAQPSGSIPENMPEV